VEVRSGRGSLEDREEEREGVSLEVRLHERRNGDEK